MNPHLRSGNFKREVPGGGQSIHLRMDSRLDFPPGFSVPAENEIQLMGSWAPATPEKPIPARFNSMPALRQGTQLNQCNWGETAIPSRNLQEVPRYIGQGTALQINQIDNMVVPQIGQVENSAVPQFAQIGRMGMNADQFSGGAAPAANSWMINRTPGSYLPPFHDVNIAWAQMLGVNAAAPAAYPYRTCGNTVSIATPMQSRANCRQGSLGELLLANQSCSSSENSYRSHENPSLQTQNELPVPHRPWYDLNAPPGMENDATSWVPFCDPTANSIHGIALENSNLSMATNISGQLSSTEGEGTQSNLLLPTGDEAQHNLSDGLLQNIVSSSSAVVATPSEETKIIEILESEKGLDLNQTPAQKPPKRRKHRPKVIVEGKPKRASKVATTQSSNSMEKQTGKRKYVRKAMKESTAKDAEKPIEKRKYVRKKHEASAAGQKDSVQGTTNSNHEFPGKSCRRALNFNIEAAKTREASKMQVMNNTQINMNSNFTNAKTGSGANSIDRTSLASQNSQLSELLHGIHHSPVLAHQIHSSNKITSDCTNLIPEQAAANRAQREHAEVEGSTVNTGSTRPKQHSRADNGEITFPTRTDFGGNYATEELLRQTNLRSVPRMSLHPIEDRGSKRKHHQIDITEGNNSNPKGSLSVQRDEHWLSNSAIYSENHNKHKAKNGVHSGENAMPSHAKDVAVSSSASFLGRANAFGYALQSNSYINSDAVNQRQNAIISKISYDHWPVTSKTLSKSQIASEAYHRRERTGEINGISLIHDFGSSTSTNNIFRPLPEGRAIHEDQIQSRAQTDIVKQQQTSTLAETALSPRGKINRVKKRKDVPQEPQEPSASKKGGPAVCFALEEIIRQLEDLHLSRKCEVEQKTHNALVPYKGEGKIVPYEGSGLLKKRKPRPKVDLDLETERVWKLLMEKEVSEIPEQTDQEKEKWWEEERRVFHGRADSFIARMHLVQGDRRFSKWKGSVVDSVIGVFLTQNVSDHLSSSAFMALAARFPLKPTRNNTSGKESTSMMIKQPDISKEMLETIKWIEELLSSSHPDQSNQTLHEATIFLENYETSWVENPCIARAYGQNEEEEVLSSQGSSDSFFAQPNGVGSYSVSNSEAEELASGCKPNKSINLSWTDNPQMKTTNLFEEYHCGANGSLLLHEQSPKENEPGVQIDRRQMPRMDKFSGLEDSYTFAQPTFGTHPGMQRPVYSSNNRWHATAESEVLQGDGLWFSEGSKFPLPLPSSRFSKENKITNASKGTELIASRWEPLSHGGIRAASPSCLPNRPQQFEQNNHGPCYRTQILVEQETSHSEIAFSNKSGKVGATAAQVNQQSQHLEIPKPKGNVVDIEEGILVLDKESESMNKLQKQTSELYRTDRVIAGASKKAPKTKKGKAYGARTCIVDWDSLRKEAQATSGRKERSKETMDSLDYEALRSASVSEVSKAIKERGMNNMLAERIKEFLDRMVREHGSIDLEWLRDVPPEKAKDYLLSIRGLGLKSVECIRLLTLHHLAFPVDTNVGRIAVRLGWVPLQPLPESLQLHLLELYPVLETVQKYLWPRLCKLDQRTLYELHYQLITFGKVFCTKNRPNCNACPMRAECRHFASAFASARLALPAPEEKSLTTSISPLEFKRDPSMVINMPLLQSVDSLIKRAGSCIPIIEEPATPEQEESQAVESDIEDAVTEDSNEIPTINLNMEEFKANVQNYMQENMELQEGDMSKALVVIHPNAASIPMPKLKNVSRLRTEHQVYELPDSHPLLEGMDRREPDDPSPYLLAIWSPGETPEAIQLPGQQCECHEPDILCNNKTCFSCNNIREANSETVRGTLLIPCRTAMKGSFPLNGTYFQVNEVFADHKSSIHPINVPRAWIWNLPRRMVYFGTSVSTIFKGLTTGEIQQCFWKGFVCVRGFEHETRAPRPLSARLHLPASKLPRANNANNERN